MLSLKRALPATSKRIDGHNLKTEIIHGDREQNDNSAISNSCKNNNYLDGSLSGDSHAQITMKIQSSTSDNIKFV